MMNSTGTPFPILARCRSDILLTPGPHPKHLRAVTHTRVILFPLKGAPLLAGWAGLGRGCGPGRMSLDVGMLGMTDQICMGQ